MPKEMLTLYTKLFVNRGNGDENLIDLLSTPDLGIGDPEKVEVTNLQDGTRRYINGLKDVGDSLEFEFNYTTDGYEKLKEIEESKEIYVYKVVLPDGLCFEFEAALSVKITGAAVGEQIKMTINLTPYSAIKVGQYDGSTQVNEYSTFRIGQSRARSAGTLKLYDNSEQPIEELYINNVAQELPTGVINDWNDTTVTNYEVNPGDIIKIRGGFSLWETELPLEDIIIQDGLKNCEGMFSRCINLIEAPVIPNSVTNCRGMFSNCVNLSVIPQENIDLINNPPEGLIFENCYMGCPSVADQIPANWGGNKVEEPVNEYTTFTVSEGTLNINNCDFYDGLIMTEWYIDGVQQSLPPEGGMAGSEAIECQVLDGQQIKIKGHFTLYYSDITSIDDLVLEDNLTNYYYMFGYCMNLTRINISNANTENVTNMRCMFVNCMNLTKLDLTSFDTSKVTNMNDMFTGCKNLVELDLSSFDTSNVTSKTNMFENVPSTCMIKVGSKWTLTESETGFTGTFTRV